MKLVREHINEVFTDDSDPVHDLGIGISELIKNLPQKIIAADKKYQEKNGAYYYNSSERGCVNIGTLFRVINILEDSDYNMVELGVYSDEVYYASGEIMDKLKYCKYLIKQLNILNMFSKIKRLPEKGDTFRKKIGRDDYYCWQVNFYIKPEYVKHFTRGSYDQF